MQILMAGAPRNIVILNGVLFATFLLSLHAWYIIPLNVIIHFSAIYLTKMDDQFFDCLKKYLHKKSYYST